MNDLLALVGAKYTSPSSERREHRPNEVEIATRAAKASAIFRGHRAAERNHSALRAIGRPATSAEVRKVRGLKGTLGVHKQMLADPMLEQSWHKAASGQMARHFWFRKEKHHD